MEIFEVTREHLNDAMEYIGSTDLSDWPGHIHISANLGIIRFTKLSAKGRIWAKAGSGIEAGEGIKAGEGIEAGWGIEAGLGIEAGEGIKAGWGIEAGEGIEAGWGIEAGSGIGAGFSILAQVVIARLRIFAGLCLWRLPRDEEKQVRAKHIEGELCFGEFVKIEENSDA